MPPNGLRYTPLGYRWASVDNAWEQRKLEARKLPENGAESPASSATDPDTMCHSSKRKRLPPLTFM